MNDVSPARPAPRVLFIATRAPYGRMHGHKMGMRTYIRALQGLGYDVVVAAFDVPDDVVDKEDLGATTRYVKLPSKAEIARNVVTGFLPGKLSLNECLYMGSEAERTLMELVREVPVRFVVADMIRTARYADAMGVPWLLDHEDLLSERYEMWAGRSSGNENILGYLEPIIPSFARGATRKAFRWIMRRESRLLAKREVYWTNRARASSLRSLEETARLGRIATGRAFCMPVTVPIPPTRAMALDVRPMTAVFVGGLTYQPNLDAIRAYVRDIIPEFGRRGVPLPVLNVVGAAPDNLRAGLDHPSIRFLGYVPDVNEEVQKAQVFFAPIVSGTGIKTKVLEALACGVPLIALPFGLTGLRGAHGEHYLRAQDATEFVSQYERLRDDACLARRLGASGRELAIQFYSIEAAMRMLGPEVNAALGSDQRGSDIRAFATPRS
ncbi:MAG: glycosyltransferase [Acetobacteraceae bacterium]